MELREPIETINEQLKAEFGTEFGGSPRFRVVWSEDQYEKRMTNYSPEGLELTESVVREMPKYKQYIHAKYILERLVPVVGETDLLTKVSYEPAWVFQDKFGRYLPPFFEGCKYIIDSMYEAIGKKKPPVKDPDAEPGAQEAKIKKMEDELFGNETTIGDALAHGWGVTVPGSDLTH